MLCGLLLGLKRNNLLVEISPAAANLNALRGRVGGKKTLCSLMLKKNQGKSWNRSSYLLLVPDI